MNIKIKIFQSYCVKRICILCLFISVGCNFHKQESKTDHPFKNLNIESISVENQEQNLDTINPEVIIQLSQSLQDISNKELIKDKGLHGAKSLCSIRLKTDTHDILLFVQSKDNDTIIDFYQENKKDNFNYYLGALYDSQNLVKVLNHTDLKCSG